MNEPSKRRVFGFLPPAAAWPLALLVVAGAGWLVYTRYQAIRDQDFDPPRQYTKADHPAPVSMAVDGTWNVRGRMLTMSARPNADDHSQFHYGYSFGNVGGALGRDLSVINNLRITLRRIPAGGGGGGAMPFDLTADQVARLRELAAPIPVPLSDDEKKKLENEFSALLAKVILTFADDVSLQPDERQLIADLDSAAHDAATAAQPLVTQRIADIKDLVGPEVWNQLSQSRGRPNRASTRAAS